MTTAPPAAHRKIGYDAKLPPITREQAEQEPPAERITFPDRKQDLSITIKARVEGFDCEIGYVGSIDGLLKTLQRLRDLGGEPTIAAPAEKKSTKAQPYYDDDGTALCGNSNCSRHGKPLEPSQHNDGYYCKGKDATTGNSKGYCKTTA